MSFILSNKESGHTLVPDLFIRDYMPSADGNFVKIYLFLLMLCQHPAYEGGLAGNSADRPDSKENSIFSVSSLADCMECTEKDICRALRYWQKEGLLSFEEKEGEITSITLLSPAHTDSGSRDLSAGQVPGTAFTKVTNLPPASTRLSDYHVPPKQNYTPLQAEAFKNDAEINRAINEIEQILCEPVSPAHLQTILYFMCDVGFSSDLVVMLYRVAVQKGKKKSSYIEAIGISWASQGITTPEQAQEESLNFSGRYAVVSKAFGIQGNLKPAQREIVDSWNTYRFSDSIIAEACKRTVLQTGDANFQYASKILENWYKKQVSSLKDIEKCDESYKKQRKNAAGTQKRTISKNQFQNFPQREYSQNDYDSLEQKLLRSRH